MTKRQAMVLAEIASHGADAFPSQTRIAGALGVSQPTVSRDIAALIDAGHLSIVGHRKYGRAAHPLHVYRVNHAR